MKIFSPWRWTLCAAGAVLAVASANAQQVRGAAAAKNAVSHSSYDVSREVSVQGSVVSYTEHPASAPIGARVVIQTGPGNTVEALLGDARLLKQQNFTITTGSNLRVLGETMTVGGQQVFVARVVQQGTKAVALRSTTGAAIVFSGNRGKTTSQSSTQGGAR